MWGNASITDCVDASERRSNFVQSGTVGMRLAPDPYGFHYIEKIRPGGSIEECAIVRIGDRLMYIDDFYCERVPTNELRRRVSGPLDSLVTLSFERRGFSRLITVTVPRKQNRTDLPVVPYDFRDCAFDTSSATSWNIYHPHEGCKSHAAHTSQYSARGPGSAPSAMCSGREGVPADRLGAKRTRDEDGDAARVSTCAFRTAAGFQQLWRCPTAPRNE
jgi:hypothetical protein